jgi:hypothetical protein
MQLSRPTSRSCWPRCRHLFCLASLSSLHLVFFFWELHTQSLCGARERGRGSKRVTELGGGVCVVQVKKRDETIQHLFALVSERDFTIAMLKQVSISLPVFQRTLSVYCKIIWYPGYSDSLRQQSPSSHAPPPLYPHTGEGEGREGARSKKTGSKTGNKT